MPRTLIPTNTVTRAGVAPVAAVAADTVNFNYVANGGKTILELTNGDAAPRDVIVHLTTVTDGQPTEPRTYTLAAAEVLLVGPFPTAQYGAQLQLDTTSALVTVAPISIA